MTRSATAEVLPPETTTSVAEYSATAAALADLRQRYADAKFDVATTAGMKAAIGARRELRDLRVALEAKRVEIKAPALERCRLIDAEAKRITHALSALEDPIDAQIKAEEQRKAHEREAREAAERIRVSAIQQRIQWIAGRVVEAIGKPAADVRALAAELADLPMTESLYGEHLQEAVAARHNASERLATMAAAAEAQEAEAARLAAERKELSERQAAIEREERDRRERIAREDAERKARQDAEDVTRREQQAVADRAAEAERQRVGAIREMIDSIRHAAIVPAGESAKSITSRRATLVALVRPDTFGEFAAEAEQARQATDAALAIAEERAREREQAEAEARQAAVDAQRKVIAARAALELRANPWEAIAACLAIIADAQGDPDSSPAVVVDQIEKVLHDVCAARAELLQAEGTPA